MRCCSADMTWRSFLAPCNPWPGYFCLDGLTHHMFATATSVAGLGNSKVTERMRVTVTVSTVMGKIIACAVAVVIAPDTKIDQQSKIRVAQAIAATPAGSPIKVIAVGIGRRAIGTHRKIHIEIAVRHAIMRCNVIQASPIASIGRIAIPKRNVRVG
jgi:hypothetical protein